MADGAEDVQPLVCDNGSGMVKVCIRRTLVMCNIFDYIDWTVECCDRGCMWKQLWAP